MPSPDIPDAEPLRTFDWTASDGPAYAVVAAVAAAADESPVDIEPLYGAVDPGALDRLLTSRRPDRTPLEGAVAFEYHGYDVVLVGHGRGYLYDDVTAPSAVGRTADGADE